MLQFFYDDVALCPFITQILANGYFLSARNMAQQTVEAWIEAYDREKPKLCVESPETKKSKTFPFQEVESTPHYCDFKAKKGGRRTA